jgi:hypothetical protein
MTLTADDQEGDERGQNTDDGDNDPSLRSIEG